MPAKPVEVDRGGLGVPASPSGCQPSASAASADATASSQSGIPNAYEVGFVEYRSLAHALWTEAKRIIRTWRFARRYGFPTKAWSGVYQTGTEYCVAAVGPLPGSFDRAFLLCDALNAASAMSAGTAEPAQQAQGEARQRGAGTADAQTPIGDS